VSVSNEGNARHLSYSLNVRLDPSSSRIDAKARIRHAPGMCFYLNGDLTIRSITANGRSLPFHRLPEEVLPYSVGTAVLIEEEFQGDIHLEYGGTLTQVINGVNMVQADLVELALYAAWYPAFAGGPLFEYELQVGIPQNYLSTGNGVVDRQVGNGDRHLRRWRSPGPCSDIVLIASPYLRSANREHLGTRIEAFFRKIPEEYIAAKGDSLVKAVRRLSELYGPPQITGLLRYVYSPRDGWGYSRMPLIVVPEDYALSILDQAFGQARDLHGACHELAHFWWMIADTSTPDDWINEGLAEYSAFRLSEEFHGEAFADILVQEYREHAGASQTGTPIVATTGSSDDRYVNRYEKTALIYIEARRRYGQESLDHLFRALYTMFAGTRGATTDRFLEEAERQLGSEARDFLHRALHQGEWIDPGQLP
jgi:hypothetical protein